MMRIHVVATGQFDNIGDTMHRRVLLDWLRPHGAIHVFVGDAPRSFVEGLRLQPGDRVFSSLRRWVSSVRVAAPQPPVLAFSSGEMKLGRRRAAGELALYPLVQTIRVRRGEVFRIGVASSVKAKFEGPVTERIIRRSIGLSTKIAWRTEASWSMFGVGTIAPDLAFAERSEARLAPVADRDALAVTMRFDRPLPSDGWLSAVRRAADRYGLGVVVTSQVRRDNPRSSWLARELGGEAVLWRDARDHAAQEATVRGVYGRSLMIVSDRLHALIAATTEGCVPVGLTTGDDVKIRRHFDVVGIEASLPASADDETMSAFIDRAIADREKILARAEEARDRLESLRAELCARLEHGVG